jgi:hypothetical protein
MVDSVVLCTTNLMDIEVAYPAYLDTLCYRANRFGISSCSHESLLDSVLKRIDSDFANEIFKIYHPTMIKLEDTTLINPKGWVEREFNIESRLMKYFKSLEEKEKYFRDVIPHCLMAGTISPSVLAYILCIHKKIDFNDFNYRLWISISLLTIIDPLEMKFREYLEKGEIN